MTNIKMVRGLVLGLAFSVTIPAAATDWAPQPNANIKTTLKKRDTKKIRQDQADLDAQIARLNRSAIQMMTISQPKKTKAECAALELDVAASAIDPKAYGMSVPSSVISACKADYGVQVNPVAMRGLGKYEFGILYDMIAALELDFTSSDKVRKEHQEKKARFVEAMISGNSSTEIKENVAPFLCETSHVKGAIERFNGLAQDLKGFRDQYIEDLKKVEANEKAQKAWPAYTDGTNKDEGMYTVSDLVTMYDMDALLSAPNLYDANIRGECVVNKNKKGYVNEKVCVSAGLAEELKDGFGVTERQALAQKILSNRRSNELLQSLQLEMRDGDGVDLVNQVARILDVQPSEVEKRCQKVIADRDVAIAKAKEVAKVEFRKDFRSSTSTADLTSTVQKDDN